MLLQTGFQIKILWQDVSKHNLKNMKVLCPETLTWYDIFLYSKTENESLQFMKFDT